VNVPVHSVTNLSDEAKTETTTASQSKEPTGKKSDDAKKTDSYPKPSEEFQLKVQAGYGGNEKQDAYPKPSEKFQQSLKETVKKSEDSGQ
jgi:hypothetical protein